jgi:hypothetical protein
VEPQEMKRRVDIALNALAGVINDFIS